MISEIDSDPVVKLYTSSAVDSVKGALRDVGYKYDGVSISSGSLKADLLYYLASWQYNNLPVSFSTSVGFKWYDQEKKD